MYFSFSCFQRKLVTPPAALLPWPPCWVVEVQVSSYRTLWPWCLHFSNRSHSLCSVSSEPPVPPGTPDSSVDGSRAISGPPASDSSTRWIQCSLYFCCALKWSLRLLSGFSRPPRAWKYCGPGGQCRHCGNHAQSESHHHRYHPTLSVLDGWDGRHC